MSADQVRDIDDDVRTLFRSELEAELSPQPTRSNLADPLGVSPSWRFPSA
jgi:hypothetical protein